MRSFFSFLVFLFAVITALAASISPLNQVARILETGDLFSADVERASNRPANRIVPLAPGTDAQQIKHEFMAYTAAAEPMIRAGLGNVDPAFGGDPNRYIRTNGSGERMTYCLQSVKDATNEANFASLQTSGLVACESAEQLRLSGFTNLLGGKIVDPETKHETNRDVDPKWARKINMIPAMAPRGAILIYGPSHGRCRDADDMRGHAEIKVSDPGPDQVMDEYVSIRHTYMPAFGLTRELIGVYVKMIPNEWSFHDVKSKAAEMVNQIPMEPFANSDLQSATAAGSARRQACLQAARKLVYEIQKASHMVEARVDWSRDSLEPIKNTVVAMSVTMMPESNISGIDQCARNPGAFARLKSYPASIQSNLNVFPFEGVKSAVEDDLSNAMIETENFYNEIRDNFTLDTPAEHSPN